MNFFSWSVRLPDMFFSLQHFAFFFGCVDGVVLQGKIKFRLKFFNQGWFSISFVF